MHKQISPMSMLTKEHDVMFSMVHEIERDLNAIKDGTLKANTRERITNLTEFLQRHILKEEQIMFPVLLWYLGMDKPVVNTMHEEHERMGAEFQSIVANLPKSSSIHLQRIQGMLNILKSHISKEDNVLFWLAEIRVPPHLYGILVKQMDAIEEEQVEH
ncbi:MAG: hemerythrin domain-containing protein [Thaumarchaeota archaeon]|nr:hemerythrin domain-containing protein [Nitrososphaerota archaeon]